MIKKQTAHTLSLSQRLHGSYASLPDRERRVADAILEAPGEIAFRTASEVARRSGVSNATVSRMIRRLGYASYDEARQAAIARRSAGSPLYADEMQAFSDTAEALQPETVLRADADLIAAAREQIDADVVAEVAEALAHAPRVRVAGFRNSRFLADYFAATLSQFRPGVSTHMPAAGQTHAEGLAQLSAGDVAFVIGLRRRPDFFGAFMRAVADTGATVILLADAGIREAPAHARWTLTCPVATPQRIDGYAAAMALLRAVSLSCFNALGASGHQYLARVEALHDQLGELEDRP